MMVGGRPVLDPGVVTDDSSVVSSPVDEGDDSTVEEVVSGVDDVVDSVVDGTLATELVEVTDGVGSIGLVGTPAEEPTTVEDMAVLVDATDAADAAEASEAVEAADCSEAYD